MNIKNTLLVMGAMVLSTLASAETLSIRVTEKVGSQELGAFDSPELEAATLQWLGYIDRVIYTPNPIRLDLTDTAFTDGTRGRAAVIYRTSNNDEREQGVGLSNDFFYAETLLVALGAPYRDSTQVMDTEIEISSTKDWDLGVDISQPTPLFQVIAHELVHGLGFSSGIRRGQFYEDGSIGARHRFFDSFIYSSGKRLIDMTSNEERNEVFTNQGKVVFSGEATNLYAAEIVTFGAGVVEHCHDSHCHSVDGVQLQASAISDEVSLSHWSKDIDPDLLMESGSNTDDYFVSFAVLSDMGYGDMLDTQVSIHSSANDSLVLAVKSETLQDRASIDSVVLTVPLVEGLALTPTTGDMSCTETEVAWVCALPELTTNTDHLFGFDVTAEDGDYTMQIDVEHQAAHVDAAPLNNFENVTITIDTSPVTTPTPTPTPTTPPSSGGGGGCTVVKGGSDSSLPMVLLAVCLLMLRRRLAA